MMNHDFSSIYNTLSLLNSLLFSKERLILELRLDVLNNFEDFSLKCSKNVLFSLPQSNCTSDYSNLVFS